MSHPASVKELDEHFFSHIASIYLRRDGQKQIMFKVQTNVFYTVTEKYTLVGVFVYKLVSAECACFHYKQIALLGEHVSVSALNAA